MVECKELENYDIKRDIDYRIYEKFLLDNKFPNPQLTARTFKLYREIDNASDKRMLFDILVLSDVLAMYPFSEAVKNLIPVLESIEKLKKENLLNEAINIASYFLMLQKKLQRRKNDKENRDKTLSAHEAKRRGAIKRCLDLEPFLREAEFVWHPAIGEGSKIRDPRNTQNIAIHRVFGAHDEQIIEILKKFGIQEDFEGAFADSFRYFTALYKQYNDGKTCSGYALEKRKPRTDASKKNSSSGAKASIAKRKAKLKKQSPST